MHVAVLSTAVVPTVCEAQVRPGKHTQVFLAGVHFLCQDLLGICKKKQVGIPSILRSEFLQVSVEDILEQ